MVERSEKTAGLERRYWKIRIAWEFAKAGLSIVWKLMRGGQDLS